MNTRLWSVIAFCLYVFAALLAAAQEGLEGDEMPVAKRIRPILDRLLANRARTDKEAIDQSADIRLLARALGETRLLQGETNHEGSYDLVHVAELRFKDGPATAVVVHRPSLVIPGDSDIGVWLFDKEGKRIGRQSLELNSRQTQAAKVTCRVIGGRTTDSAWIILELQGSEKWGLGDGVWMSLVDEKRKEIKSAKWNGVDIVREGGAELRRTMAMIEATPKGLEFK